jgi:signal transduction histidine kinase
MLDISRIQSGKLGIHKEEFDFREAIEQVIERLDPQVESVTGTSIQKEELPKINGRWDRQRIEQVITNLLTNALKYGQQKPIGLGLIKTDKALQFFVKDQGEGISKEKFDLIFERFERAVSTTEVSGLGLGLYITKQIVESHGGKVWLESEIGKGSTFWVELPLNS